MPRKLITASDPDASVSIRVEVPGWLKNQAVEVLQHRGKSLSDWVRDEMRGLVEQEEKRKPLKKR